MKKYKLNSDGSVDDTERGILGINPKVWLWDIYQDWLSEGNTPMPVKPDGDWIDAGDHWTADLDKQRAAVWEKIKAEREARVSASGVNIGGKWFHSDPYSRLQYLGLNDELSLTFGQDADAIVIDGESVVWKSMDGTMVTMTRGICKSIIANMKVLDKRIFKQAETHRALVNISTSPLTYDYSTGWPEMFSTGN